MYQVSREKRWRVKKKGDTITYRDVTPMYQGYYPEMELYYDIYQYGITTFKELIGVLRWAVDIGRVDILTDISMLSRYQESPRETHLKQIYHIFALFKKKTKLTLYFDHQETNIYPSLFDGNTVESFK